MPDQPSKPAELTRKLAVIMFTDIVGYTKLMGNDANKALELVRQSLQIQKPLVEKYNGIWLKEMGDGAMTQFDSALNAVNCAMDIQRASRADFDGHFRIGIHLGDITIENNDVYGDGVNVASRLESLADSGGVYISDSVEKAIRGQGNIQTLYLGELELKNVDYEVRTYALQGTGLPVPDIIHGKRKSGLKDELIRRGVIRVGIVYLALLISLIMLYGETAEHLKLPEWIIYSVFGIIGLLFPLALYLAWNYERSPEGFIRTSTVQSLKNPMKASQRKPFTGNVIIVILLAVILGMYLYPRYFEAKDFDPQINSNLVTNQKSIAVLPFKNLSGSEDNLYFSDGVMEAILNNLSRIKDLKVVSRTSVERYRNQNKSIREIAQELEVANILEGSVQRIGDDVRITAQLISAENDEHLWADNYDRQLEDIFSLQSEIAQTIAENLEVILTMEEKELIRNAPTTNLKAYELFLKAIHEEQNSEEDILSDIELCQEAIALDPDFGLAYAHIGRSLTNLGFYGYPKSLWYDSALLITEMAIRKAPKAWQPYLVKASIKSKVYEEDEVTRNLKKVLELNPNLSYAYHYLGFNAMKRKEFERSIDYSLKAASLIGKDDDQSNIFERYAYFLYDLDIEQSCLNFRKSYERNPENYNILPELINCARFFGENDQALIYAIEYQKLVPDLLNAKSLIAESYLFLEQYEEAEEFYSKMMKEADQFDNNYMIYPFVHRLGYAMMKNGDGQGKVLMEAYKDTLIFALERKEIKTFGYGEYYDLSIICASLGQKEEAYKWLNAARDNETEGAFFRIEYLISDPMLDNLREDPEFKEILQAKYNERNEVNRIFNEKLEQYHVNNELKWLAQK